MLSYLYTYTSSIHLYGVVNNISIKHVWSEFRIDSFALIMYIYIIVELIMLLDYHNIHF